MGFSFSGIVIDKKFDKKNIDSFSNRFDFDKLMFDKEVQYEKSLQINFDEQYLDFYTTENATIVFCSSPDLGDRMNIEKASYNSKAGFFLVDETSMTMMATLFENVEAKCQYSEINNEIKQAYKKDFETKLKDGFQTALDVFKYVTGLDFFKIDSITLNRFKVISGEITLTNIDTEFTTAYNKYIEEDIDNIEEDNSIKKNRKFDTSEKFIVFKNLSSLDNEVVKSQIEELNNTGVDTITINYILMVSLFHHDKTIRALARKVFKKQGSEHLQAHIKECWERKFLKEQTINRNKLLEHEEINKGESLSLRQVLRKNYFTVYPASGYNLYTDGRGADIGEVFDSFIFTLKELPDTFELLEHVTYINLVKEKQLNFKQVIDKIVKLPSVKTLKLEQIGLDYFPVEIFKLQNLERLVISRNDIKDIPNVGILPELKVLEIQDCKIEYIDLKMFPQIEQIWMAKWRLERIDLLNIPRPLKITTGAMYNEIIDIKNHFGEFKERNKELSPTMYIGNGGDNENSNTSAFKKFFNKLKGK